MNYIFLDIDGVLNCRDYILENKEKIASIDENRLKLLSDFCQEYNCLVILSSSWRTTLNNDLTAKQKQIKLYDGTYEISRGQYMLNMFKKYNIPLVGKTSYHKFDTRGQEIRSYIEKNFNFKDNFIILDDEDDDISSYFKNNFIQTDFYKDALCPEIINKMVKYMEDCLYVS